MHFSNSESTGCLYEDDSKVRCRRYAEGQQGIGEAEVRVEVVVVTVRERETSVTHLRLIITVIRMKPSILMLKT